jgi:hypothetical protein
MQNNKLFNLLLTKNYSQQKRKNNWFHNLHLLKTGLNILNKILKIITIKNRIFLIKKIKMINFI